MKKTYKNPKIDSVSIYSISVILDGSGNATGDIQGSPTTGGGGIGGGSGKQAPKVV